MCTGPTGKHSFAATTTLTHSGKRRACATRSSCLYRCRCPGFSRLKCCTCCCQLIIPLLQHDEQAVPAVAAMLPQPLPHRRPAAGTLCACTQQHRTHTRDMSDELILLLPHVVSEARNNS